MHLVSAFTAFKVKIMNTEQNKENSNIEENINQNEPMIDDAKSDDLQRVLAKNNELLGKLKKAKEDNAASIAQIEQMQTDHQNELESVKGGYEQEIERLKQVEADFESYRKMHYMNAMMDHFNVFDGSAREFVIYKLQKMGYDIQFVERGPIYDEKGKCRWEEIQAYCLVDQKGNPINEREFQHMLNEEFAAFVYGSSASGSGATQTTMNYNFYRSVEPTAEIKIKNGAIKENLHFGLK